jgi:hypothetical protein
MGNDLVNKAAATGLSAFLTPGGANPFTSLATEYNVPTGAFLKFSGNTGEFSYKGQVIEHGSIFAFNMMEMRKGWICWKDGKAQEQHMVRVLSAEQVMAREELADHGPYKEGEGWTEQIGVPIRDLEGGDQLELNLSSKGGRNALIRLANEYGTKARMNLDDNGDPKVPLVEVSAQSFKSKLAAGTKWAPIFKIVNWMTIDELMCLSENAGEVDAGTAAQHAPSSNPQSSQPQTAPQAAAQPPMQRRGVRMGTGT